MILNNWLKTTQLVSGETGSTQVGSPQIPTKLHQDMWEDRNSELMVRKTPNQLYVHQNIFPEWPMHL